MKNKIIITALMIVALFNIRFAQAIDVVELKLPNSNKIIIKLMFRNGSITDPAGKLGLTDLTANTIIQGGTKELTSTQVKDILYPMAADFSASVDKEVTIFTFSLHRDFIMQVYPIIINMITEPRFAEEDFFRIKSNAQNYVDEIIRSASDEDRV